MSTPNNEEVQSPPTNSPGGGAPSKGNKNRRRKNNNNKKKDNQDTPKKNTNNRNNRQKKHGSGQKKKKKKAPAEMTVIVQRVDVWDIPDRAPKEDRAENDVSHIAERHFVAPYHFAPDVSCWVSAEPDNAAACTHNMSVNVIRAPRVCGEHELINEEKYVRRYSVCETQVVDTSIPNPHPPSVVHDKYWAQRRRLFSRFDRGIQLDAEGWFSVTPQVIAHHVAARVGDLSNSTAFRRGLPGADVSHSHGIVVLDAFCGCGGNSIAFCKLPSELISLVISVDVDRSKLRMAAHNASLYDIPQEKIIFVECNTMHVMEHCYQNGQLNKEMVASGEQKKYQVEREEVAGYSIGGLDLLPERIDAVFMDPPWGGMDYNTLGKNGYDLEKHMKIRIEDEVSPQKPPPQDCPADAAVAAGANGVGDDFFDTFSPNLPKNAFEATQTQGKFVDGLELLKMAAGATQSRLVIYDMPRNTNKTSLGRAALAAGYRGNLKLEEYFLNRRLKTVTAYLGADYSGLLH